MTHPHRMPMKNMTIDLASHLAPIISSRDLVADLRKPIFRSSAKCVDLDFQGVVFISRSAAHELLLLKDRFDRAICRRKAISFINANNEVAGMLRVVAASRAVPRPKEANLHIEKMSIENLSGLAI